MEEKNKNIQSFFNKLVDRLTVVEVVLSELRTDVCTQFAAVINDVAIRLNWSDKQVRANDPLIRSYVREHPEWTITKGAFGGVQHRSISQKKEQVKIAKEQAKAEIKTKLGIIDINQDDDE